MAVQRITRRDGSILYECEADSLKEAVMQAVRGGANLWDADLRGADLRDARLNWRSHELLAEILRRAAGNEPDKREVAGLVLISRDWCWEDFLKLSSHPLFGWALDELARYCRDGDDCPAILRERSAADIETTAKTE